MVTAAGITRLKVRTVIDIPDEQVAALDRLAAEAGTSRAAPIRKALRRLLDSRAVGARPRLPGAAACGTAGVKVVFDSNILIKHLLGVPEIRAELGRFRERAIKVATWAEVLVGVTPEREAATRAFLEQFEVVELSMARKVNLMSCP